MRQTLLKVTVFLFLIAGVVAALPFVLSMYPTPKAYADRPRVKIPELRPGQYAFVHSPRWRSEDWLFVRRPDGQLNVWRIPVRDGAHLMPDCYWWRAYTPCEQFAPQFEKGVIVCSAKMPEWAAETYVWSLDGKALHPQACVPDMEPVIGFDEFGDYVAGKR